MSSLLKNIFVGIICLGLAGLAYYFITDPTATSVGSSADVNAELVSKTQAFIERSSKLQQINIDVSFFTNPTFTSLRSFAKEVPNQPLGKKDIFSATEKLAVTASKTEE